MHVPFSLPVTVPLLEMRQRILHAVHRQANAITRTLLTASSPRLQAVLQRAESRCISAKFTNSIIASPHCKHDDATAARESQSGERSPRVKSKIKNSYIKSIKIFIYQLKMNLPLHLKLLPHLPT